MKLYLFLISACIFGSVSAQQNHFIYLQTDNKQPFYVQVNDKTFSSSASGYVVIPKLQNGTYNLNIGFPKNEWPQQSMAVMINNRDVGYLLKNFDSKGWGLFDMQTMNVIMSGAPAVKTEPTEIKTDAFSNVLADVVNTPSLKEKPVDVPVQQPEAAIKKPVETPVEVTPVVPVQQVTPDIIKVLSSTLADNGRSLVYVDHTAGSDDTVRIFIPYEPKATAETKSVPVDTAKAQSVADAKSDTKFINIELPNPNTTTDSTKVTAQPVQPTVVTETSKAQPTGIKMINSDCKSLATEEDFLKARKKMVSQSNDDEMVAAARKAFRSKCFSTEQVKNLSVLFLKDEGKYKFFDAAYPFVHDTENFNSLDSQLQDEYYKTRFRAMIRR